MFFFNEFLYYHQITKYNKLNNNKIITINFFSLIPTRPNTKEREYSYKRSTLTHIIFIHIIPQIAAIYCMINNNRCMINNNHCMINNNRCMINNNYYLMNNNYQCIINNNLYDLQ
jgi:hypothetical protein